MKHIISHALRGVPFVVAAVVLTGCFGIGGDSSDPRGAAAFLVSTDGGATFDPSVTRTDAKTAMDGDVLTIVADPQDAQRLYIGTRDARIFTSDDKGRAWRQLPFLPEKVYGIAVDTNDANLLYATGTYNGLAKIYKSYDRGENWDEIYTEPTTETVITALAIDRARPNVLYAGTSKGTILRTTDGGQNWRDIRAARYPVTAIVTDSQDSRTVYFLLHQQGLLKTRDGGDTIEDLTSAVAGQRQSGVGGTSVGLPTGERRSTRLTAIATDPIRGGTVYVGSDQGVYRSTDYGTTWTALETIGSADRLAVKVIAVDPHEPGRIVYGVARTLYFSDAAGGAWTPIQVSGSRIPSTVLYDPIDTEMLFVGLQKG